MAQAPQSDAQPDVPAGGPGQSQQDAQPADAPDSEFAQTVVEFAPTSIDEQAPMGQPVWPEASDGKCSETAALFAASQPAPLTVV